MAKTRVVWRVTYLMNGTYTNQYFTADEFNLVRTCINDSDDGSAEVNKLNLTQDQWEARFDYPNFKFK